MKKHSKRAKDNTRKWLTGVIKLLEKNLQSYSNELILYGDNKKFKKGILRNVQVTKKSLLYYYELRIEYTIRGLI